MLIVLNWTAAQCDERTYWRRHPLILQGTIQRAAAMQLFVNDLVLNQGQKSLANELISPRELSQIRNSDNPLFAQEGLTAQINFLYGPDLSHTAIIEDNTGYLGGTHRQAFNSALPEGSFPAQTTAVLTIFSSQVDKELQLLAKARGWSHFTAKPNLFVHTDGKGNLYFSQGKISSRVRHLIIDGESWMLTLSSSTYQGYGLRQLAKRVLNSNLPIDAPIRLRIESGLQNSSWGAKEMIDMRQILLQSSHGWQIKAGQKLSGKILTAILSGTLSVSQTPGLDFLDSKFWFSRIPKMIRVYLKQTPILDQPETYTLSEALDKEGGFSKLLTEKDSWVLKPVDGRGGEGVVLGFEVNATTWRNQLSQARLTPDKYLIQRRVEFPRIEGRSASYRTFVFQHANESFPVHDYLWRRTSGSTMDSRTNVSLGGTSQALFKPTCVDLLR